MAIIYSYPKVTSPLATDVLVLTDTTLTAGKRKNKTKSLALSDLAAYVVSSTSGITGGGTLNTIPLWTPNGFKLGDSIITQAASGQAVTITGQLDVTEDFNVTGSTELFGSLTVEGVATFDDEVECNNNVTVQGVFAADGNSVFSGSLTIDEQLIDGTGGPGTAGQVLSSTSTGVEWISDGGGSVTGTGTTNAIPMWTDGPGGVLGDSPISSIDSTNSLKFVDYTAIAVATTESLTPNQSNQAPTEDTLAILSVDPDGNVVRGSQEGTWTFTKAQLDTLGTTTATGNTLIQAPGADKAVIVEESNWMITYSDTGSMADNSFIVTQPSNFSTGGANAAEVTRIPSSQINIIMSSAPTNPSYGFYSRDLPLYNLDGRTYKTNEPTMLVRVNSNPTPANLISISIKLKYRLFDATTF